MFYKVMGFLGNVEKNKLEKALRCIEKSMKIHPREAFESNQQTLLLGLIGVINTMLDVVRRDERHDHPLKTKYEDLEAALEKFIIALIGKKQGHIGPVITSKNQAVSQFEKYIKPRVESIIDILDGKGQLHGKLT